MKLSKLLERLSNIKEKYGDLEVQMMMETDNLQLHDKLIDIAVSIKPVDRGGDTGAVILIGPEKL